MSPRIRQGFRKRYHQRPPLVRHGDECDLEAVPRVTRDLALVRALRPADHRHAGGRRRPGSSPRAGRASRGSRRCRRTSRRGACVSGRRLGHSAASSAATIAAAAPAGARSNAAARSRARAVERSGGASSASVRSARSASRPTITIRPSEPATASSHSVVLAQDQARNAEPGRLPLDATGVGDHRGGMELEGERCPVALRIDQPDRPATARCPRARAPAGSRDGSPGPPADRAGRRDQAGAAHACSAAGCRFSARWTVANR